MTKEIYISSTPHETRLAVVEDDQLAEIYYERENEYTLAGSVYKGKVTRVLPGMQSAFVDIGLERDAFLYVTDFAEEQEDGDEYIPLTQSQPQRNGGDRRTIEAGAPRENGNPRRDSKVEANASEPSEGSESGGRRWRGRRGRRRGRGGAPQQNPSQQQQDQAFEENEAPALNANADESNEPDAIPYEPESAEEAIAAEHFAPPVRREQPAQASPMVLPGESLSKYRRGQAPAQRANPVPETSSHPSAPASTFRPSTMVTGPIAWDGSDLLPGESLSRHKNRPSTPAVANEPELHVEDAQARTAEPFASPAAEAGTETLSHDDRELEHPHNGPVSEESAADAPEFEPEHASASYRLDPTAPSAYRQSSILEPPIEESSPVATAEHADVTATDAHDAPPEPFSALEPSFGETASIAETQHLNSTAPFSSDTEVVEREIPSEDDRVDENGLPVFDPGHGILEEEMLDGEENENESAEALLDDEEYDDLVEETLDMQMDSGLLGELVRDQHIDERTHFDDDSTENNGADNSAIDDESDFQTELSDVEMDEIEHLEEANVDETTEEEPSNADAATRQDRSRGNRRGFRGRGQDRRRMRRSSAQTTNLPVITELLKPNQEILVQIAKEPIARKGARITSHIALPGRFLVFMPTINHVGVSRKISSDEQRLRLKHILLSEKGPAPGGFIVRTAAATASEEDLRADIRFLLTLWAEIKQRADNSKPPALIYHDLSLVERVLRDQVTDNFSAIWVDSEADYERVLRFLNRFEPALVRRVKLYTKEIPLFEQFGIQDEINKALHSKVWLKSGGSIVINQTEALVAIDINTGKYVGKTARLEDTILKTNLDAIPEIVRQIRLRDLGGIIVIDFIDMDERRNRAKVMQALEEQLKSDRAPSKVLQFNDFGLVAITRKRVKQSLERTLSVPCTICTGTGMVKGPVTVCNEIYVELRKMHKQIDRGDVLLRVNPEVVKQLKSSNGKWLTEMEELSGKTIIVKSDPTLHPEQFDIH